MKSRLDKTTETERWWKARDVYASSKSCFGSIDAAVVAWSEGALRIVIRGWLFHETSTLSSLSLSVSGKTIPVLYHGFERADVTVHFSKYTGSLRCGFIAISEDLQVCKLLAAESMIFNAVDAQGMSIHGRFPAVRCVPHLCSSEEVTFEALQKILSVASEEKNRVLVLWNAHGIESPLYVFGETLLARLRAESLEFVAIDFAAIEQDALPAELLNIGGYAAIVLVGESAFRAFAASQAVAAQSIYSVPVIYFGDPTPVVPPLPVVEQAPCWATDAALGKMCSYARGS